MIPGLYTYAATAIVAGALAFGAGWQTQEWRYGKQIAGIQAQHAVERPADPGLAKRFCGLGVAAGIKREKGSI